MHKQLLQGLQEELIETTMVEFDNGTEWVLDFYIQSLEVLEGSSFYGIKINLSTTDGVLTESDETFAITEDKKEALAMVKTFAKGKVLPISLLEIVDDWQWQENHQTILA